MTAEKLKWHTLGYLTSLVFVTWITGGLLFLLWATLWYAPISVAQWSPWLAVVMAGVGAQLIALVAWPLVRLLDFLARQVIPS